VLLYASTLKEIAAGHPLFFRDYYDIEEAGRLLARSAAAASYRSITYLKDDSESGAWHAQGFIEEARALGLEIKYQDEFSSGEPDLRPVLLKLSRYKPQAMVFCAWRDVHTVMKQLKELGLIGIQTFHLTAPFFPIADTVEMRRLYAENKTISSWYGFAESTSDQAAQGFIRKFRARFGRTPFPDSAFAYDDVMILAQGLAVCSEAGAVEQPCLADYLQRVVYEGPAGRVHFGAARSADRPVIAIKLTGGRWEEVG